MKLLFFTLALFAVPVLYAQSFSTGALMTDPEVYDRIGQAPLPSGSNIPAAADLSAYMPPPGSQYPQNSCVAWTVAYANYSYINSRNNGCSFLRNNQPDYNCLFSPSFVYNQINGGQNRGTFFQDAFRIMQTQGVAPLSKMPYVSNNWWVQPSAEARQAASAYKINSYWQLGRSGEDFYLETKAWLAKGFPVIASVKVDNYLKKTNNFPTPYVWSNWSGPREQMGHAILIVGYNDQTSTFKFINSYGPAWGNSGYGYISYGMYRQVLNEAFIIKTQLNPVLTNPVLNREEKKIDDRDKNAGLYFQVENVNHFQFPPNRPVLPQDYAAATMTFHGTLSIPPGTGQNIQVAIYFYYNVNNNKGPLVRSINPFTRTLKGQAVTQTPELPVNPAMSFTTRFYANFRYADLAVPHGYPGIPIMTSLIAEPVLLVDGFPLRIGNPHLFFVNI